MDFKKENSDHELQLKENKKKCVDKTLMQCNFRDRCCSVISVWCISEADPGLPLHKCSSFVPEFIFMNNYQLQNRAVYTNPVAYMIFQRNTKEPGRCQTTVEDREGNICTIRIAKETK